MTNEKDSLSRLLATHTPEAIRARLGAKHPHSYLRDFIFGAVDGIVTTFAVVAGVAGAGLSAGIIVILGLANLVGDGFSMAAGNFLATRAEKQQRRRAKETERHHIEVVPAGEKEEIRQIFAKKGFSGGDLERVVDVITADKKLWVETMLKEELGFPLGGPSPVKAAATTFAAFVLCGFLPLLVFVYDILAPGLFSKPFWWSAVMTGMTFFTVGAVKGRFVAERWYFSGLETLLVGGVAASLAYLVGLFLGGLAGLR